MALLLQCLRDVRIQTGDLDMLPPTVDAESSDPGWPRLRGDLAAAATPRPDHHPTRAAPLARLEPAEACH